MTSLNTKTNFLLALFCSFLIINCSSDTDEFESPSENTNQSDDPEIIIIENEDTTEEMIMTPEEEEAVVVEEVVTPNDNEENTEPIVIIEEENTVNEPDNRVLTASELAQLNFATTSIFDKTSSSPNENAKKWNTSINLFLSGAFGTDEVDFINDFAAELAAISSNIDLNIVSTLNESNVEVYFATREAYITDRPNFIRNYTPRGTAVGRANTSFRIPSFFITGTKIWIDPSSFNFNSVIKHEILHILGLDHTDEPDSILFPTPRATPELSENDIFTLNVLYNSLIQASSVENEIITTVENNIEEFYN